MNNIKIIKTGLIAVYAKGLHDDRLLGYIINSSMFDAEAYFEDQKGYGLEFKDVEAITIPTGYSTKKKLIQDKIKYHKEELAKLETQIKHN